MDDDPTQIGRDIAAELCELLGRAPELVLMFSAARYDHARVLAGLYERLPTVRVVGCSSFGEINSEEALSGSVTAMGIAAEGTPFATFVAPDISGEDNMALAAAVRDLTIAFTSLQTIMGDSTELREVAIRMFAKFAEEEIARPIAEAIVAKGEVDRTRQQQLQEDKLRAEI